VTSPGRGQQVIARRFGLRVVVRGFWHPIGHLGDYHIACGRAGARISHVTGVLKRAQAGQACATAPEHLLAMKESRS
jgi:hypothetical protein